MTDRTPSGSRGATRSDRWRQQQPSHWDIEDTAHDLAQALAEEFAYTGANGIAAILEHADLGTLHHLNEEATRIRMERHGLKYRPGRQTRRAA